MKGGRPTRARRSYQAESIRGTLFCGGHLPAGKEGELQAVDALTKDKWRWHQAIARTPKVGEHGR